MVANESDSLTFRYYKGYPARCMQNRWLDFGCATGCLVPLLTASIVGLFLAAYGFNDAPRIGAVIRLVGLAAFTSIFGYFLWDAVCLLRYSRHFRIVPYFQQRLGDIHTFRQGNAIAKECRALDEMSQQLGVTPLSAFGFCDDFHGEEIIWHSADEGLTTVVGLFNSLQASDQLKLVDKDRVINELAAIANALLKASERSILFCLIINPPPFGPEADVWKNRKGS